MTLTNTTEIFVEKILLEQVKGPGWRLSSRFRGELPPSLRLCPSFIVPREYIIQPLHSLYQKRFAKDSSDKGGVLART